MKPFPWWLRLWRKLLNRPNVVEASGKRWHEHWFAWLVPRFLRKAHKWYAKRHHFYWLPCVLCQRYRGGHENSSLTDAGFYTTIPDPTSRDNAYIGICPWCIKQGKGKR